MIDLGEADVIDVHVNILRKRIASKSDEFIHESRKLHDLVFRPIREGLGEVKEIFIFPDGNLSLIPFEVLQGPDGRFLIEDYTFNYLAAGRDILRFGEIKEQTGKALLMGDPDFDMGSEDKNRALARFSFPEGGKGDGAMRSSGMNGFHFKRLRGTREGVWKIRALFGEGEAEVYTGKEAMEEFLRHKSAPRYLHLATHGFFLLISLPPG